MAHVAQVKVGGAVVRGLYRKVDTEGDAYRFVTAEAGSTQIIHKNDTTVLPDGRQRVTVGATWRDYVLEFPYLIGIDQLEVHIVDNTNGVMSRLPGRITIERARAAWLPPGSWPSALLDPASLSLCYFEELSSDTVRVYNLLSGYDTVHFSLPCTSLQGAVRERVQVKAQSDKIAIELLGDGDGLVLHAPGGKRGMLRIDDELNLGVDPA